MVLLAALLHSLIGVFLARDFSRATPDPQIPFGAAAMEHCFSLPSDAELAGPWWRLPRRATSILAPSALDAWAPWEQIDEVFCNSDFGNVASVPQLGLSREADDLSATDIGNFMPILQDMSHEAYPLFDGFNAAVSDDPDIDDLASAVRDPSKEAEQLSNNFDAPGNWTMPPDVLGDSGELPPSKKPGRRKKRSGRAQQQQQQQQQRPTTDNNPDNEATEETWARRLRHREAGLRAIKRSNDYVRVVALGVRRPQTPDPTNREIRKRVWERGNQQWRMELKRILDDGNM